MKHHNKFNEVLILVKANQPVLLTGEKGTGKTTMAMQIADEMGLEFRSMSMTRQTTLSHLLGFINVNGNYVRSHLREAAENGGFMLLDEIDAADANVLLSLNTIENGFITFPDAIVKLHPDFRLIATSNPQDNHQHYTGRTKLDGSTLDRFDIIDLELDEELEKSMVDPQVYQHIDLIRDCLKKANSKKYISMRDSLRFQQRKNLNLLDGYAKRLFGDNELAYESYVERSNSIPEFVDLNYCQTVGDIWNYLSGEPIAKDKVMPSKKVPKEGDTEEQIPEPPF